MNNNQDDLPPVILQKLFGPNRGKTTAFLYRHWRAYLGILIFGIAAIVACEIISLARTGDLLIPWINPRVHVSFTVDIRWPKLAYRACKVWV